MQIYDRFKSNPFRFWASVTNTNRPIAADSLNNHILNANDANGPISRISSLFQRLAILFLSLCCLFWRHNQLLWVKCEERNTQS